MYQVTRRMRAGRALAVALPAAVLVSLLVPFFRVENPALALALGVALAAVVVAVMEIGFRIAFRVVMKRPYQRKAKIPFDRIFVEPHPYLPFVYKKNFPIREAPADYVLHPGEGYVHPELRTNRLRHLNGPDGGREVEVPKPEGRIRIVCLGASTTQNYLGRQGVVTSYPLELERILGERFPGRDIEVANCGMMGWTSAEIVVKFLLDTVDTDPDFVVWYHANNDLAASLTPDFASDYSHSRLNFGEVIAPHKLASKFPDLPLAIYNVIMNSVLHQNILHGVIESIQKTPADIEGPFRGLDTYRRNLEHLLAVCGFRGIELVVSTYCYFLHDRIRELPAYQKYRDGVALENDAVRAVAAEHGLALAETDRLVPRDEKYFMDAIHFTPEGMTRVATHIADALAPRLEARLG